VKIVLKDVPFNRAPLTGGELRLLQEVIERRELSGDGHFCRQCETWLSQRLNIRRAMLAHSCTGALEMAAILANLAPGDEVIMPSFTFVSTANAVVLRGAVPVFVDIRPDTLNLDERLVESAITPRTKAIFVVHYAGVCAEMDAFQKLAEKHKLFLVEDAAQALLSTYRGKPAGTLSDAACFSFHVSKNVVSGEGGALVTNRADLAQRAEIIREKGTNRARFMLGLVDKYTWIDVGSSYIPSELVAAFLRAQLDQAESITSDRRRTWQIYHDGFADIEARGIGVRRPVIPDHCCHNGHLYYLLMPDRKGRDRLISTMRDLGITLFFHYVPLHSSEAGQRYGRTAAALPMTDQVSDRLVRMPIWAGMTVEPERVISTVYKLAGE